MCCGRRRNRRIWPPFGANTTTSDLFPVGGTVTPSLQVLSEKPALLLPCERSPKRASFVGTSIKNRVCLDALSIAAVVLVVATLLPSLAICSSTESNSSAAFLFLDSASALAVDSSNFSSATNGNTTSSLWSSRAEHLPKSDTSDSSSANFGEPTKMDYTSKFQEASRFETTEGNVRSTIAESDDDREVADAHKVVDSEAASFTQSFTKRSPATVYEQHTTSSDVISPTSHAALHASQFEFRMPLSKTVDRAVESQTKQFVHDVESYTQDPTDQKFYRDTHPTTVVTEALYALSTSTIDITTPTPVHQNTYKTEVVEFSSLPATEMETGNSSYAADRIDGPLSKFGSPSTAPLRAAYRTEILFATGTTPTNHFSQVVFTSNTDDENWTRRSKQQRQRGLSMEPEVPEASKANSISGSDSKLSSGCLVSQDGSAASVAPDRRKTRSLDCVGRDRLVAEEEVKICRTSNRSFCDFFVVNVTRFHDADQNSEKEKRETLYSLGSPCDRPDVLNETDRLDRQASDEYERFVELMRNFDCEDPYSTSNLSNCSECLGAYRQWLCVSLLSDIQPTAVEGQSPNNNKTGESMTTSLRPCRSYCDRVSRVCPYLSPHASSSYAGEPLFSCVGVYTSDYKDVSDELDSEFCIGRCDDDLNDDSERTQNELLASLSAADLIFLVDEGDASTDGYNTTSGCTKTTGSRYLLTAVTMLGLTLYRTLFDNDVSVQQTFVFFRHIFADIFASVTVYALRETLSTTAITSLLSVLLLLLLLPNRAHEFVYR